MRIRHPSADRIRQIRAILLKARYGLKKVYGDDPYWYQAGKGDLSSAAHSRKNAARKLRAWRSGQKVPKPTRSADFIDLHTNKAVPVKREVEFYPERGEKRSRYKDESFITFKGKRKGIDLTPERIVADEYLRMWHRRRRSRKRYAQLRRSVREQE